MFIQLKFLKRFSTSNKSLAKPLIFYIVKHLLILNIYHLQFLLSGYIRPGFKFIKL